MFTPKTFDDEILLLTYRLFRCARKQVVLNTDPNEPSILQLQALLAISLGKSTMSDLAEELHIAHPTATVLVDKLVKAKYIIRKHDKKDRRVIHLLLTESGEKVLQTYLEAKLARTKFLLENIPSEDKKTLYKIFSSLLDKLETTKEENLSKEKHYVR